MEQETCFHCTHVFDPKNLSKECRRNIHKIHGEINILETLKSVYGGVELHDFSDFEQDCFVCSKCYNVIQGIYRSQRKLSTLTDSLKSVASTKFSSLNPENTTVVYTPCPLAEEKRSPTKKRSRECLTPVKSGYTPHGKKPLPASCQTPKARRKKLNFNKTPRQTPKSTTKSPVSPGPKVKVHLGFKGSSRQTTLKGSKGHFSNNQKKMSQELQQICQAKDSVLRTKNLEKFSWKKAYDELKQTCPLVTELMLLIAGNKNKQIPRIVSSIAILLFNRNSQMGAIQAINSILMFRGHIRTKVYTTFNRAGLSSSYKSSIRHVDQICQNFDQPVGNWANRVASHYTKKLRESAHSDEHNYALSSVEDHTSCSTTLPVLETPAKGHTGTNPVRLFCESPFECSTPESESPTYMYTAVPVSPLSETPRTSLSSNDLDTPDRTSAEVFTESPYTTVMATETDEISSFQIVMDNLNMMTKARHKTEDTSNKMHNLVHALAVQDRVSADDLEDCVPQADILTIPNEAFLPSKEDYTQLNQEYNILIQRVLVENIIELKECKEFIPLGILEKDENKTEEMIEIIEHLQQYTPKAHDKMMPLLMGGDGLSVERGEGAQRARADGISQEDRLEGFIWKSEDWHAHVISLQDTFNQLFKGTSSPEKGTLFQLRNLFEHRGVKSEVKDAVNSCRDFLRFVTQGYVILAALNVLNMHSVNEIEESLSTKTKEEKKTFMENLSKSIVSKFLQTETPSLKQKGPGNKINQENRVPCGFPGCQKTFFRDGKCRLNHRAICPYRHLTYLSVPDRETDLDQQSTLNQSEEQQEKPDYKFNYSCCLLREGLQDWIREDSSKENDGDRLVRMWRFDFLRFSLNNHTKYRLLAFRLQAQLMALLPPKLAHQLRHNRCINIHGVEGCNVPADQALEFLNMRAKDALNSLHGNMSSASIQRCGRSLQGCNDIIDSYTRGLNQYFVKPTNSKQTNKFKTINEKGHFKVS
ncbi:unnamed protein product [Mytilus edulis]|uniref:DUF6589 domain-containing protein n=1 Tax=Mytilus edulis TaxID=6550 RepID=A0A8S3TVK2_MYTED|nr:unnamed protein product [Mytilus edulis]